MFLPTALSFLDIQRTEPDRGIGGDCESLLLTFAPAAAEFGIPVSARSVTDTVVRLDSACESALTTKPVPSNRRDIPTNQLRYTLQ